MAAKLGVIDQFDSNLETWEAYIERFEQFVIANDITREKKVAVFLSVLGSTNYGLLRTLCAPDKPSALDFDRLKRELQNHLSPRPLVIAERFRFYKRDQRIGESISQFTTEIRKLSELCEFQSLDNMLRDRLVCGLTQEHSSIQKRLLSEVDLTFRRALEISVGMERAAKDSVELIQGRLPPTRKEIEAPVHKIAKQNRRFQKGTRCFRCRRTNHAPDDCLYKNETCHGCGKVGHIKPACLTSQHQQQSSKQPKRKSNRRVNAVNENSDEDNTSGSDYFDLHSINDGNRAIYVHLEIEGKRIQMELDTGAAVSVMNVADYEKYLHHIPLRSSTVGLKTYTDEKIKIVGVVPVNVTYNGQRKLLELFVAEKGGNPLFGRDWFRNFTLNWTAIKALSTNPNSTWIQLDSLLQEYADVFSPGIGKVVGHEATVAVEPGSLPRFHKARPVPYAIKPQVEAELERLKSEGIISPVKHSKWAAPIVPVIKRNGKVRLCGDFKVTINPVLQMDKYPLPRIDDIFSNLSHGQRFSKIDLSEAYLQMEISEECKEFLTINTHKGLYRYNRLVYGVASAPSIWQRTMDQVLQGIPSVQCFMDDIIATGETDEVHLNNLKQVLTRLQEYGMKVNRHKCEFFKDRIEYCGHVIDSNGLHKSEKKIEAVKNALRPTDLTQLRSLLGMVNYYHKFLPKLSTVLQPLNQLLQADQTWKWGDAQEKAFLEIKRLIASDLVLTHYDVNKPVRLETDASPYGIGAVITHVMESGEERPIAFASRTLSKAEQNYSQIEKEGLSVIFGLKKFNQYLEGRAFTIVTDHQPLLTIFHPSKSTTTTAAARLQRWALYLGSYQYSILYRSTKKHANADCLSRLPASTADNKFELDSTEVLNVNQVAMLPIDSDDLRKETNKCPILSKVLDLTMNGGWNLDNRHITGLAPYYQRRDELSVHQGCILWGSRVIVPNKFRDTVLQELHEGHMGIVKMKCLSRSYVWWPGLDDQIETITKSCNGCQETQRTPNHAPLHPWEFPSKRWQRLHVDFAGPFLGKMFFIIVDAHSKWPEVIQMNTTTASQTIDVLRSQFARWGLPEQLVSDNGPQFVAEEFATFMKQNGIRHITSAPYHPATNGLAERLVQSLKKSLRAAFSSQDSIKCVKQHLASFLMAYRNTPHSTTGHSPASLMLGHSLRSRLDLLKPNLSTKMDQKSLSGKRGKMRHFNIGQNIMARNYSSGPKWVPGIVLRQTGPISYVVKVGDLFWRRHLDQLCVTGVTGNLDVPISSIPEPITNYSSAPVSVTPSLVDLPTDAPIQTDPCQLQPPTTQNKETTSPRRYPTRNRRPPDRLDI